MQMFLCLNRENLHSKSKNTPFDEARLQGKVLARSLADKRFTAHEHPTRIYIILRDHAQWGVIGICLALSPLGF